MRWKMTYRRQLFVLLLGFSWTLVACFVGFQYMRERSYKAERLNERLQTANALLLEELRHGTPYSLLPASVSFLPQARGMRITLIQPSGRVVYDNQLEALPSADHRSRPEVARALKRGTGFTIDRHSATNEVEYFYSAKAEEVSGKGMMVVRTALPYDHTLRSLLEADRGFLWFMLGVTVLISLLGAYVARALARREERERMHLKRQLTNNINHELKTPVASVQLCLETLREHPELPEEKRGEFVDRAYAHAERLRRLLVDVATITRLDDGGERAVPKEPLVLNQVINEAIADEKLRPEAQKMEIIFHPSPMVQMRGNAELLNSVFRNLLTNALAYSGGTEVHVAITGVTGKSCVVEFWDNGCGVGEEHIPHLMDRFYRVDAGRSRRAGGTGLGLAIVKNAVQIHGGNIKVFNRAGGGLKFVFTLGV